jgi:SAM-dependent methyltransferase
VSLFETIKQCRSCGSEELHTFLDLGTTPLADRLVKEGDLDKEDLEAPLTVAFCEDCTLVQILETVDPEVLFQQDYPYYSSVSPFLMRHFQDSALALIEERGLSTTSLVIEAASNDGYMLKNFKESNIPVLGIDPAQGPAAVAREAGIETMNTFFTKDLGEQLRDENKQADVFIANNVLAHVPDLNGFVQGIAAVLKDDGIAVIECPYLLELMDHCEFDTIYHQHLCYFSVKALDALFRRHELFLNHVDSLSIHGGSLRLFVGKKDSPSDSLDSFFKREDELGVEAIPFYDNFASRVEKLKSDLMSKLDELKAAGKTIGGYGAAAKACTLLAYCGIDRNHLDWVADLSPRKHGLHMGGNHLPIVPPEQVEYKQPDYLLILAWNFANEIMSQRKSYSDAGGHFIVPVPSLKIVE